MSLELAPGTLIVRSALWTLAVNRNQNLLGKTMLVANRPVESVSALRPDEWSDLHFHIRRVTGALDVLFRPDQYNHAFLMNADAQVHLHVVPRYRTARQWGDDTFTDPHFGEVFGTELRPLHAVALTALASSIRGHLPEQ